jgi:formylglycine-generating enzyme required for sulfatase activity
LILGLSAIGALTVVGLVFAFVLRGERARSDPGDAANLNEVEAARVLSPRRDDPPQRAGIPAGRGLPVGDETPAMTPGAEGVTRDMPPELARQLAEMLQNRTQGNPATRETADAATSEADDRLVWRDERGDVVVTTLDGVVLPPDDRESAGPVALEGPSPAVPLAGADWTIPPLGLEMVYLHPDTFMLGSPPSEPGRAADEGPLTRVTLAAGFWLGRYEVTRQQWIAVMGPLDQHESVAIDPETPVSLVTGDDAVAFCRKLTAGERAAGRLPAGLAYALPSEAQWEYACRAGTSTPFHTGNRLGTSLANIDGSQPYGGAPEEEMADGPIPVGNYPPNAWGFFDMHGNVWEWTASAYSKRLPGGAVNDDLPLARGGEHVLRGGSWRESAAGCRSAVRLAASANVSVDSYGFRLALVRERERER